MDEIIDGLTYAEDEANLNAISEAYHRDLNGNTSTWDVMADNFDQVRTMWPGQSRDQIKRSIDAKPWRFASDAVVPTIEPRKDRLVAILMNAVRNGNITAIPVGSNDAEESSATSNFMRWMMDSWIPDYYEELELSASNFVEKGLAVTFPAWEKYNRLHLERFDLDAIAEESIEVAEMLADPDREDEILLALQEQFEYVDEQSAKKALKQLRNEGVADIPVVKQDIDRPTVSAKDPSADVILPPYAMSGKKVSRVHYRSFLTAADILSSVETQGWDKEWAEDVIENYMGVTQSDIDGYQSNQSSFSQNRRAHSIGYDSADAPDLVEIAQTFLKLIDKKSGAIGIYQVVWCPKQAKSQFGESRVGLYELMNGHDELPVVITPFMRDTKRIYDVRAVPERLRGNQRMAKVTRDSTIDQFSIANNPPRTHPAGRPPNPWGAGAEFATRRGEEGLYRTLDIPDTRRDGVELERYLNEEADYIAGLTENSSTALQLQQHLINRWLSHVSEVARFCYKNYQKLYGKDEIYFRVTGVADPQVFNKTYHQEELDIRIVFDAKMNDPEHVKETTQTLLALKQSNTDGTYSNREIDAIVAHLTVPQFASRILRDDGAAQAEILKNVAEDLALIWSGQQVGARSEGANIALEYIQNTYLQKQNVNARLAADPEFAEALQIYMGQYQQQAVQAQNATRGRLGTQAAELQGINNG